MKSLTAEQIHIRSVLSHRGAAVQVCDVCLLEFIIYLDGPHRHTCTDCIEAALDCRVEQLLIGDDDDTA